MYSLLDWLEKNRHTGENRCPAFPEMHTEIWIPAFAGMTGGR